MTENALKCKYNGGTITYGYTVDVEQCYQIDPLTAPVVLDVFSKFANGQTIQKIVNYLKETEVSSARNGKITFNTVSYMLHNRKYIGEYKYRNIFKPDGIPAIVPKELFDKVQKRMEKKPEGSSKA
jgi:site-specific DNA recombinase